MTRHDDRSLVDQALDAFVYAPLGILLEVRDLLPKLAERGRGQVALTRLAGKVAAERTRAGARPTAGTRSDGGELADALPIADYDDLSAPSILPALEELSDDELAVLLGYEQAHRARATVINRIKHLQA